ncbi:hypothetical protein [Paenibacillus sonchi]|nr:hypothetical protein [Paenibacillus sonchi]
MMIEQNNRLLDEFIRKKAFPFILDELLEEHEEEKIDLIINGLEYTYKNEVREESKMLVYFDVLRELRVDELKRLFRFSQCYRDSTARHPKLSITLPPEDPGEREKYREKQSYEEYIDNHLESLGLIDKGKRNLEETIETIYKQIGEMIDARGARRPRLTKTETKLTLFGSHFVKYFELVSIIEIPAD